MTNEVAQQSQDLAVRDRPAGLQDVKLHLVDNFDTACEMMRWLGSEDAAGSIAVDTETTGLVIGKDHVRLAQLGGMLHGWAIPYHLWGGLFGDAIKRYEGDFDMHNAKFDEGMLAHNPGEIKVKIPRHRIHDTRIMSHILEPNMSTALKPQAARHVDAAAAGLQMNLAKTTWTWENVPWDYAPYWSYGALDTVLTRHLKEHHYPRVLLDAPDAYELERAYQWVAANMERYGAHIDVPYAREKYGQFMDFCARAEKWIMDEFGVKAGSNAAIIEILQAAGFVFDKQTASGAWALDKEVLDGIDHPLATTVKQRRQLQKLASTYLHHFITEADANGMIHPSINTLGARTSRMSMERPNLQNLPRKSSLNPAAEAVRNSFLSRYADDGGELIMCDFDQIEMRLMAFLSNDPGLIAAFKGEDDFFINLAREIFDDPTLSDKKDPRRQLTKNTGYATIYGAGVAKSAATAGVSEDQMRAVRTRWDRLYPGTSRLAKEVERVAWARQRDEGEPYVRCPVSGRRQVGDKNKIYALVNYLIQGAAASLFKKKQLALDAAGLGDFMVVPVHDEIILDVPMDSIGDVVQILDELMNDMTSFSVPITASVSHGKRWGEKVDWDVVQASVQRELE